MTIKLLGPPDVRHDGRPVGFRARKAEALLAYLAAGDGARSREEIIALLWPGGTGGRGRSSLRSALAGLRGALDEAAEPPGAAHLVADGGTLSLASGTDLDLDLRALKTAHTLARAIPRTWELQGSARRDAISCFGSAAGSYRGDFLEGFVLDDAPDFDFWLDTQRESWRGRLELVYDRLSRLLLEDGEPGDAIAATAAWTERAPLAEEAHRRLMEAQLAAGDRSGALNTYEALRSLLKRELGTAPGPETEALVVRAGERAPTRPPRTTTLYAPKPAAVTPRAATRERGLRVLSGTPFVGRSEEFGALANAYGSVLSGGARAVAVVGEAGIGKTRLAEEFFAWAEAQGADVVRGRAHEVGDLPYWIFVDALRPRVERERAPDDLLEDVWLSELARLLPELKERYPDLPPPAGDESQARARLFEAISRLVAALASGTSAPVVLFMDDLHWASLDSLDALRYAGRRWAEEGARVLIVLALRPEATETPASPALRFSELSRELPVELLELEHLAPEETLGLLRTLIGKSPKGAKNLRTNGTAGAGEPSEADLRRLGLWLYEETGGQPLFLAKTLKLLSEKGVLVVRTGPDGEPVVSLGPAARDMEGLRGVLPESVREAILDRLSRLGGVARKFLAAGAVLDAGFTFRRALEVAGLDEGEGLDALDEALGSRLVEEVRKGRHPFGAEDVYAFAHDKVRDVVYTEAGAARRRVFHRRALETLESERGVPPAELARHAQDAGVTEAAFRHLLAAGDAALELLAANDAVSYYERARRLFEDGGLRTAPPVPEVERLYASLGRACEVTDDRDRASLT